MAWRWTKGIQYNSVRRNLYLGEQKWRHTWQVPWTVHVTFPLISQNLPKIFRCPAKFRWVLWIPPKYHGQFIWNLPYKFSVAGWMNFSLERCISCVFADRWGVWNKKWPKSITFIPRPQNGFQCLHKSLVGWVLNKWQIYSKNSEINWWRKNHTFVNQYRKWREWWSGQLCED